MSGFNWTETATEASRPLTKQDLLEAIDGMTAAHTERVRRIEERLEMFERTVPEDMRGEDVVRAMRAIIYSDYMLHPREHQALKDAYNKRLREVRGG